MSKKRNTILNKILMSFGYIAAVALGVARGEYKSYKLRKAMRCFKKHFKEHSNFSENNSSSNSNVTRNDENENTNGNASPSQTASTPMAT